MIVSTFKVILAGLAILTIFSGSTANGSQQLSSDPLGQKVTLVWNNSDLGQILEVLSHRANVPIGFEAVVDEKNRANPLIKINVKGGTVRDVLDEITRSDPRYKWEMMSGVINVLPKESRDSILDILVSDFNVINVPVEEISFAITDTPEVRSQLKSKGIIHRRLTEQMGVPRKMDRVSLTLSNLTVRQILNELLTRRYTDYWAIEMYGNNNEFIRVILQ